MILFWSVMGLMTLTGLSFVLWPWIRSSSFPNMFILMLFLLSVGASWWQWGNARDVTQWFEVKNNAVAVNALKAELGNTPEKVIERLKKQLEKNPNSAQGWFLLGKLYMSQQQFENAVKVFEKAEQLQPNDKGIMMEYAQALFMTKKTKQAVVIAKNILLQDPQNPRAINLLGSHAFQQGAYQEAINQWEKLRNYYSEGSEDAQALNAAIERAKAGLSALKIPVHIAVSAQLKSKVSPNDIVFIYARDAESTSPMPLLIMRKQASELPMSIVLDESMKMNPEISLKHIKKIIIVARISKTGQAKSQVGDLEGKSEVLDLKRLPPKISLFINTLRA